MNIHEKYIENELARFDDWMIEAKKDSDDLWITDGIAKISQLSKVAYENGNKEILKIASKYLFSLQGIVRDPFIDDHPWYTHLLSVMACVYCSEQAIKNGWGLKESE